MRSPTPLLWLVVSSLGCTTAPDLSPQDGAETEEAMDPATGMTGAAEPASTGDDSSGEPPGDASTTDDGDDDDDDAETTAAMDTDDASGDGTSTGEPLTGCAAVPDALLCEDFEADLDPAVWAIDEGGTGSAVVEDGELHIHFGSANASRAFIQLQPDQWLPVAGNHFFGRVRFRVDPIVPDRHNYMIAAAGQLADGSGLARYRLDLNNGQLNSRYTSPAVEQHGGWRKYGRDLDAAVWLCIEWEYDGATNSMRYWFDDELDTDMVVDGATEDPPWIAPEFTSFEIGYHTYQAAENGDDFDAYYDDLVIALERVGCP